jgi:putative colanic acid biosynthesis UDP-glucose lipid carrier transferase
MNMVTRATRSRELSGAAEKIQFGLDGAGILVGGANRLRQARGPVGRAAAANAQAQNVQGNYTPLDLENRRRWPIAPLNSFELFIKRAFDIVVAGTALVALMPLLALVAIVTKLDSPGPVIFRQTRRGLNGKPFHILKFRTMTVLEDGDTIKQAVRSDKRVTRVGLWWRRTSIDELPQLINVLRGEMSIVGPRPHAAAHDNHFDQLIANYALRHRMKPGITGYAQVKGLRGETPTVEAMQRRVDLDLWYIDNWSFLFDFAIVLRTVVEIVRGQNAY